MNNLSFRPAIPAERTALEDLQWRASLMWEDYRDALLENPDAIDLPLDQITMGERLWRTCSVRSSASPGCSLGTTGTTGLTDYS